MKKTIVFLLIAFVFILTSFVPAYAQSPIKLKYSNYFPPNNAYSLLGAQFCEEVKNRTNGRVEITYFPGGILLNATKMYDGVVNRLSDIGLSHIGYTRGRFPVTETLDLPVGYASAYVATHVKNDFYNKFKPKEWDNVHLLYFWAPGVQIVGTKSRPVKKLEDLKGLKLRGTGRIADTLQALGATPVPVEMVDCYDGLQRGVLDGVLDSLENWKNFKLADLLNHGTLSQRGAGLVFTFYVAMNKESWDALPDDIKQILTQVSAEWQEKTGVVANQQEIEGRDFLKRLGGKNIYSLSEEEIKKWQRAVEPVIEQHMKELETKGFKRSDTGEYLKFIRERIDYWGKQEKERKIPVAY